VLSLLLQARDTNADASRSAGTGEDGEPLTDRELRDELMTLVLAGHETTATALAWTFELLFRRPDALERATAEARAGGPTEWLDAVGAEALRLKPPLPMAVRRASRPVTVGGTELPEGTRIGPCIYLTHRRPDLYPQPRAFRPERFLDERVSNYAWLPFGGGIRRCVGAAFAQLELRTILRTVLERAELRPASGRPARTRRRAIVLAPSNGAEAVLVSRD
jgi:cytochrome P450